MCHDVQYITFQPLNCKLCLNCILYSLQLYALSQEEQLHVMITVHLSVAAVGLSGVLNPRIILLTYYYDARMLQSIVGMIFLSTFITTKRNRTMLGYFLLGALAILYLIFSRKKPAVVAPSAPEVAPVRAMKVFSTAAQGLKDRLKLADNNRPITISIKNVRVIICFNVSRLACNLPIFVSHSNRWMCCPNPRTKQSSHSLSEHSKSLHMYTSSSKRLPMKRTTLFVSECSSWCLSSQCSGVWCSRLKLARQRLSDK